MSDETENTPNKEKIPIGARLKALWPGHDSTEDAPNKIKIPIGLKLKVWWEGYDSDEIAARIAERAGNAGTDDLDDTPAERKATETLDASLPVDPWNEETIEIAQYVWGDGFCGPGGPEYIVGLSKLLALSPEMSMVQLGAGLGGPARTLAERFGVWVTGYEASEQLVAAGNKLSKIAGMEKKAAITYYNPEEHDDFERQFDRILSKEALFTIKNKSGMIHAVEEKLKPSGLFLITDYVVANDSVYSKDTYKQWRVGEPCDPCPSTVDGLKNILKEVKLQVRVSEDITDEYISLINHAWAGADKVAAKLVKQENGPALIQTLMREAEFWARRKKMLESGDLRLWRIVANKKAGLTTGMSDW